MSDARRIPGQSILARLGARGIQRPSLGASPAFYERFGLADLCEHSTVGLSSVTAHLSVECLCLFLIFLIQMHGLTSL